MEIAEGMEVEEASARPMNSNRLGLKNCIQTNFGDDYVFEIVPKDDWTSMGVALSNGVVKLYSPQTGQYIGECRAHSSRINQISFSGPSASATHVLYSCSDDGTIRAWDSRSFQQVSCISAGPSQEVYSFSFGGPTDNLLAAGCKEKILIWDWRMMRQTACLEESHTEDVTQVHFVPGYQSKLFSASVDGLMCLFDTNGDINDEDSMVSVVNVDSSIGKVGFFGEANQKLWCLTHDENLSVWDWKDARIETNFEEARKLASHNWKSDNVNYFVDCHYSAEEDRLWAIGGTYAGTFGYFPVTGGASGTIGSPEAVFQGGHTGIIRSVLPMSSIPGITSRSHGIFGWSGSEDGRLCCWLSDGLSTDTNCSWIASALVEKSPKARRKSRHSPY